MERRQCLRLGWGLLGAGLSAGLLLNSARSAQAMVWQERALIGFGTTLWLKAAHEDTVTLERALDEAVAEIRHIERVMSLFHPESELVRLNANGRLRTPDPQLVTLLGIARQISQRSAGAFDVSMQPFWSLWSEASSQGELPSSRLLRRARQLVSWHAVRSDPTEVMLERRGMSLSLNGIAQGWAADRVRAVLAAHGIRHAMIDCGETALLGNAPSGSAWRFAIEDAVSRTPVRSEALPRLRVPEGWAIATSSDRHTSFSPDHQHHHILDPRTGYSPGYWSSVTVLAPTCVMADALTKVFFMLPASEVLSAARRWGVDVLLQAKSGNWLASPGLNITKNSA